MPPCATTRNQDFHWIISIVLCAAMFAACSKVPEKTVALQPAPTESMLFVVEIPKRAPAWTQAT